MVAVISPAHLSSFVTGAYFVKVTLNLNNKNLTG